MKKMILWRKKRDYKKVFRTLKLEDVEGNHIQPTPRWDLQKVYVFTKDIPTDQLRNDLEKRVGGVQPPLSSVYAIQSILYVFPTEMPDRMPTEIKELISQEGFDTNAVFIRGATNPYIVASASREAGNLLYGALEKLGEKYNKKTTRISWRFKEAETLMNTAAVLAKHDPELVVLEYLS